MLDRYKLKGKIAERGYTQAQVAKQIGMTESTFSRKMATGKFGIGDAEKMILLLGIDNASEIFFAPEVN